MRDEIIIKISDGTIDVITRGKNFLSAKDVSIKKNELKSLLVSGARETSGTLTIEGIVDSAD